MIADILTLTRNLIIFDFETTGTHAEARATELAFEVHKPDRTVDTWRSLINPEIPIPPEVTKIHGITNETMKNCRVCGAPRRAPDLDMELEIHKNDETQEVHHFKPVPVFAQLASRLAAGFSNCDFAGKNPRFDLGVMAYEMARAKQPWSYAGAHIIDSDRLENLGEPRDLMSLYKRRTGKDLIGAHGAASDVAATRELIEAQLMLFTALPRDLPALHEAQYPGWIDSEGKFRFRGDTPYCTFGKYRDRPMRSIDAGYWKFVLKKQFSDEIKKLASEALAGRFPQKELNYR